MHIRPFASVFAAVASISLSASPAAAECVFAKIGEMKVESRPGRLFVDIEINGVKKKMMINTGSVVSSLTQAGADSLGVKVGGFDARHTFGSRGENVYESAQLKDVVIGGAFRIPTMEISIGGMSSSDDEIVGYLGQDILGAADIEFDLAHDRIAFYQPKDCAKADLIYWSQSFSLAPLRRRDPSRPHFQTEVALNGKAMNAMISTTASYSMLDQPAAKAAGVTPETPGVTTVPPSNPTAKPLWIATFNTFSIGDEQVKNVKLTFSDLWSQAQTRETGSHLNRQVEGFPSMMLGLDFLQAHRVLLAKSQGRMYMTYNGGGIFRTPNSPDATPPPR